MGTSLVTAPALEPLSLDEVIDHCRVTNSEEQGLIAGYILAARHYTEDYTRRKLIAQTWDYTIDFKWPYLQLDCYWRTRIDLPFTPAVSVTSIDYIDASGNSQTLDESNYVLVNGGPVSFIEPVYDYTLPDVRWQPSAITVRYVAGYGSGLGDIPEPLRQAMLMLIGHWYEMREAVVVGSAVTEVPLAVEALLSLYRQSRILS